MVWQTNVEAEDKKKNPDKTSGDMKGVTFFNNYGQHDDRYKVVVEKIREIIVVKSARFLHF